MSTPGAYQSVPDTYQGAAIGRATFVESMGDPIGPGGLEVSNTLEVLNLSNGVGLVLTSRVSGSSAPHATTEMGIRISDSDARKLRDHLNEILCEPGRS